MKEIICIVCPNGCHITTNEAGELVGGKCARGNQYALKEMTAPERTLTSTVAIRSASVRRLSVKTNKPIPKEYVLPAMKIIRNVKAKPPVHVGDILIKGFMDTDADLIATANVEA